ncbi:tetratricopeptide repeat protein [Dactylosporangium sp. NPDC005555]|uniref:ATP-binding protein n=1 Tax=Dactylosporangium sp. NPDC005555 TaxID=3154889 RepID=UPI0033AF00F7
MREDAVAVGTMEQLARLLRDLRLRQSGREGHPRLTYRRIAARTGWSHGIVGEYLAGRVLPPTDRFDDFVRLLGADPGEQRALAAARDRVEELRAAARGEEPRRDKDLRGDSTRDSARDKEPAETEQGGDPPRQLPADLGMFAGRKGQLDHLDELLARRRRPIVVSGTAGVGKTALAVHWAHRVAGQFPDGQLFLDLRGSSSRDPVSPFDALGVALGLLGVPPAQVPAEAGARARRYRQLVRDKRMLIVLDNASTAAQVRPLLPGTGAALALVTSRAELTDLVSADGAHPVTLDLLDADDARTLLAGRIGTERTDREPEAVGAIVAACARLPLALSVVAARAALHPDFSLAAIAADLTGAHSRLDALRSDDPRADVETVFSWSYQRLDEQTQRLFRLIGLHPSPQLGIAAAAALADLPPDEVRPLMAELVRAQLVIEARPGRFGMHDLLCAYASDLARAVEPAAERVAARGRLVAYYVEAATGAATALNPSRNTAGQRLTKPQPTPEHWAWAVAWFEEQRPALIATVQLAVAGGLDREAWRLAWAMADHLDRGGHWGDWISTQRAAVGAAERLGDRAALALAHRSLSGGCIRSGRHEEARRHLRVAFELFVELADHAGAARCVHALAWLLETQDRFAEAVTHDELALELFRLADDPVGQARALNSVGWHHARLGHHDLALECCEEALELQRALGDAPGVAATLDSLGYIHHRLGEHDQAIERYQDALLRYAEQGDRFNEADASIRLGDTWAATGRWDKARAAWTRSLRTLDVLAHPKAGEVRTKLQDRGAGPTTLSGPLLPIPAN